jgi:hypothetical protein
MRIEVLEKQVADIIQDMDTASRMNDKDFYDYYRCLYETSIPFMRKNKIWFTDEQLKKVSEAHARIYHE